MEQVLIESWDQLNEQLHSLTMIPHQINQGGHYRSPYVFRGMSCSKWEVETSLRRLNSPPEFVEPGLLRNFRKYAPRGTFSENSEWELLSVAQHNGLPTRVLDWTTSPLVAAHFATSERQYLTEPGAIWCVDVLALRRFAMPERLAEAIPSSAALFDVKVLEATFPRLNDFDRSAESFGSTCVFFEPPSLDARIANQAAILSAMNSSSSSPHAYLQGIAAKFSGIVRKFVIDSKAKSRIRDMLDQNNVHERMLFPGLPGLCDWLRRYYGPA